MYAVKINVFITPKVSEGYFGVVDGGQLRFDVEVVMEREGYIIAKVFEMFCESDKDILNYDLFVSYSRLYLWN